MIHTTTLHDLATATDKRAYLQTLLKQVAGSKQRKEALLKAGGVENLLSLLTPRRDPRTEREENEDHSTEAAAVLAAISLRESSSTLESVKCLSSPSFSAHAAIAEAFVDTYTNFPPTNLSVATYQKQLDVHLRALKTLFVDLVSALRPTSGILQVLPESIHQVCTGGKGKGKAGDVEMSEKPESSGTVEDGAQRLLGIIYDLSPATPSSIGFPGPSSFAPTSSVKRLSPTLDALLDLLVDSSQPDHSGSRLSGTSQRMRIADHICTLLSRTVRGFDEQQAIAIGGKGKETLAALRRLVEFGSEKVQEGALNALTSIIRDSHVALLSLLELGGTGTTAERLQPFVSLAQSTTPSVRLAAITFCAAASKLQPSSSTVALDPAILLNLIEKEPSLRGAAAHAFAYLVSKDSESQKRAALASCFDIFRRVLDSIPSLADTHRTGLPLEDDINTREGLLVSLGSLTADSETNRRLLLDAKLLPHVLESLFYPVIAIRAAACQVIRALSRSVNILRTDLVEAHAEGSLIQLLRSDEDEEVQTTATAVFSNLLLEFSPMRKVLIDAGCIPRLCRLALEGDNLTLKQNALWAIKNATYQSPKAFKQSLLQNLTWSDLAALSDPNQNPLLIEQALGIIRNITCVTHNEIINALDDFGEEEVLDLLQKQFVGGNASIEAVIQSLYCLNNIATAGEASQLAIASRTPILRYLLFYLDHPSGRIRTASLWVIHNLVYRRGSLSNSTSPRQRRPHEIVEKLRVLGIDGKLRALERDPELDVRERVRDIKESL
ncbi:hypothetical protein JCM5350_005056 [Sporobolomyces pararoseus]